MNIQNYSFYRGIFNTVTPQYRPFDNMAIRNGAGCDVFVRSEDSVNFTSRNKKKKVKTDQTSQVKQTKTKKTDSPKKISKRVEETFKNMEGLHDPYSDVIMITSDKLTRFQDKLKKRTNAESMTNLLNGYTQHMFPTEKEVFNLFKHDIEEAKQRGVDSNLTLTDILQNNYVDAKSRLVNSQMDVLDEIRVLSKKKLKRDDKEYVDLYLAIIEKDIYNDSFRIKSSRELLSRLENELSDKQTAKEIIKLTKKFPNTSTNSDAFIVKNYNKSPEEIAELLISPSQISIEHIKPSSERGEDSPSNYLIASKRMNNYRRSIPLYELIEEYPNIPQQTQRYFDELIARVNCGGLDEIGISIPDVKDSLYEESNGLIDVDISNLSQELVDKSNEMKAKLDELKDHFN